MRKIHDRVSVIALATGIALAHFGGAAYGAQSPSAAPQQFPLGVSAELYAISVPKGEQPTRPEVDLGQKLFNDKRLSSDGTVACATCHDPDKGFTDHRADNATSAGVGGQHGQRNSPTVLNAMFHASEFWDGRAATLEDQAKLPILNPVEMLRSGTAGP